MPAAKLIFADLAQGLLVESSRSAQVAAFPVCFHQDNLYLSVQPLQFEPTAARNVSPYSILTPSGYSLTAKIWTSDYATVLASQTSWTISGTTLVGNLDLNTANMATQFVSAATTQILTIVEFTFETGSGTFRIQRKSVPILRAANTTGSPAALGVDTYYTASEINALFVKFTGNPAGATISLKDSTSTYERTLGVNSDGSAQDDIA